MVAQEFIYASALSLKRPRVAHAKGNPKMGKAFTVCGHPLGDIMGKIERGGSRRCEQCFIQGTTRAMSPKTTAVPVENKRPPRAEWPGTLIQNARHVRRQLEKLAVKFPDLATWAGQQSRYLKIGLDAIGAAE